MLYAQVAGRRMKKARREKMNAPVLCVGNFTVGGTGKTPIAIALAKQAKRMHLVPGFLSRGHGGSFAVPHIVDVQHDSAKHVGDEPLLLAEHAPVAVSADRAVGARMLLERGCNFLIMDDGFQSARIHIDYALVVVDARFGLGNGHVIPGGPMRARLADQMMYADAVLKMGEGDMADTVVRRAARAGKPIFSAVARPRSKRRFQGRRFLAFAGIGHPEKFFDTLSKAGGTVVLAHSFPDHHFYLPDELDDLVAVARAGELELITTSKDAARLRHGAASPEFLESLNVLEIDVAFDIEHSAQRIVDDTLEAWRRRKIGG